MLNDVHGLGLTPETVKRLHERTEGWAAGLYLAVLSMRGRDDASSFVASFTGSDRRVVDYLAAEVLGGQGELGGGLPVSHERARQVLWGFVRRSHGARTTVGRCLTGSSV